MKLFKYLILVIAFCFAIQTFGQRQKITIKYAGKGYTEENREDGAITFLRDNTQQINFVHEGVEMWCDKAIYYQNENFIEAFSNVIVKQGDTINMSAKYVEYSGKTKLAFASGNVILREPQSTLKTDTLHFDRIKQQAYYDCKGEVVRDTSGTITSQIGRYYMGSKKYQFVDDVVLVNPEYILNSERLDFFTETGYAYLFGPSTITGETSKIYCERGFYDTNNDFGHFQKQARIDYDNRTVKGDSLYFDRTRNFASATNNITITDTINKSIVKGHYAEVFKEKDSMFITKRALAITVQEKDSIYIHGDTLMLTGKENHRITRAYYNVKLYKSDLAAKADSVHVDEKTGLTQLINLDRFGSSDAFALKRKPILWNLKNQMTGDTIHLISNTKTEELDSLKMFNNAFLISKDTIGDGYNQAKGKLLIGLFRDNELYNVDIIKNAEVINYMRNDKQELFGINKTKSGSINIKISKNEIDIISFINQIDGQVYPESQFPKSARKFRGFDWREDERPLSVEDLFKDDPPLELPIIKGLDDYIPQEDFFDDNLSKRIQSAKVKDSNKAARNVPKNKPKKSSVTTNEDSAEKKSRN